MILQNLQKMNDKVKSITFKGVICILITILILVSGFIAIKETGELLIPSLGVIICFVVLLRVLTQLSKELDVELHSNVTIMTLWLARDARKPECDEGIYAYTEKPIRNNDGIWICRNNSNFFSIDYYQYKKLVELGIIPELTWESGAVKIEVTVKQEYKVLK